MRFTIKNRNVNHQSISRGYRLLVIILLFLSGVLYGQQVYTLSTSPSTFNFTSHAYDKENIAEGVRFSFTAHPYDSSAILVDTVIGQKTQAKQIDFYGTDQLFQNPGGSSAVGYTIIYPVKHAGGVPQYCIVKPLAAEAQTKDFTVYCARICTLTVAQTGSGATVPAGEMYLWTSMRQTVMAKPGATAYFTGWSSSSGLKLSSSAAKTAVLTSDTTRGTIIAGFAEKPIHTLSFVRDTFNFKTDGIDPATGVLFRFTPPAADTYFVSVGKGDTRPVTAFRLTYYKNDVSFSKADSVIASNGEIHFRTDGVQAPHYFRVTPLQLADTAASFSIKADSLYVLSIAAPAFGTAAPSGNSLLKPGESKAVSVSLPGYRYSLNAWRVTGGSALVGDTLALSTTVTLNVSDATIVPDVKEKTVWEIGYDPDTLLYATQGNFASGGILCKFTAAKADSFLFELRKPSAHGNVIYYYGTDSTFTTALGSQSQTGTNSYRFTTAAAGSTHYFRIFPASATNQKYQCISEVYSYVNVTVEHDIAGTLTTAGTFRVRQGDSSFVPGAPVLAGRYYFSHWEVVSGNIVIRNLTDPVSSVKAEDDAVIKAVCLPRPVVEVGHVWDTLSYAKVNGGSAGGVLFAFTAPTTDSFVIDLGACATSNHSFTLLFYGNDSGCTKVVTSYPSKNGQTISLFAEAGSTVYGKVMPAAASDLNDSLRIRYFGYCTLTVENDIEGSITPIGSKVVREDSSIVIDTGSVTALYYFDKWELVGGNAEIADARKITSRILLHTDADVRAVYRKRQNVTVSSEWDTVALADISGGKAGGILFTYTSPDAESLSVQFETINSTLIDIADWGTDSTLTSIVNRYGDVAKRTISFDTELSGERHFYLVSAGRASDSSAVIRYRASTFGKLTVTSLFGICSPAVASVAQNTSVAIKVTPTTVRRYLDTWVVRSGSVSLTDPQGYSTTALVDSGDAAVEAVFAEKPVHTITGVDKEYDFGIDAKRPMSGGILFKVNADGSDSTAVIAASNDSSVDIRVFLYASDSLFAAPVDSFTGSSLTVLPGMQPGSCFLRIVPVRPADDDTGTVIHVRLATLVTVQLSSTPGGSVSPAEKVTLPEGTALAISAVPVSPRYCFSTWEVVAGNAVAVEGKSLAEPETEIAVHGGNAVLNAHFTMRNDHALAAFDKAYRCAEIDSVSGDMLFTFSYAAADSYALQLTLPASAYADIWYYEDNQMLDRCIDSVKGGKAKKHTFTFATTSPSGTVYFRVKTPNMAGLGEFLARIDTTVTLVVQHRGGVVPFENDTFRILQGGTVTVKAKDGSGRSIFSHWKTGLGSCTVSDTLDSQPDVTVFGNSVIDAVYHVKKVQTVGFTLDTMSFTSEGAPDKSGGILLRFTAPRADSFGLYLGAAGKYDRTIDLFTYGSDSTFSIMSSSTARSGKPLLVGFRALAAHEECFFRVAPSNSDFYLDSIAIAICSLTTLAVRSDVYGMVQPAGAVRVLERSTVLVKASPVSPRAVFTGWKKEQGLLTIDNPDTSTIRVKVDGGPAVLAAEFDLLPAITIPKTPDSTLVCYVPGSSTGMFLRLKNEKQNNAVLHLKHKKNTVRKTLTFYGTDSLCKDALQVHSLQSAADTLVKVALHEDTSWYYFCIVPATASYLDTLEIRWIPESKVNIRVDDGGTASPSPLVKGFPGDTFRVVTAPLHSLFTFDHWAVDSGRVLITNPASLVTSIRMQVYGDAVIRAHYTVKPHDTLFLENDGHGVTVPLQYALLEKSKDTLIAAYPDKGWVFDYWEKVDGAAALSNQNAMITRAECTGNARIKARFKPDTGSAPSLVINSVYLEDHPHVGVTATLRGFSGNQNGSDTAVRFIVSQDTGFPEFTLRKIVEERGISVSLVVDRSLTMGDNSRLDSAKQAVGTFISAMTEGDRAALISFSSTATVEQEITGNKQDLFDALYPLKAEGETAIRDGVYDGIAQLAKEQNTRAVIIFSDGFENASTRQLSDVIQFARDNKVTVYSIAIGAEAIALVDATLRPLADSTGGTCYYARSASDLAGVYEMIKTDIMSRYVVDFISPDTVRNGETHIVRIQAVVNGTTLIDSVYWTEENLGRPAGDTGILISDTVHTGKQDTADMILTKDTVANDGVIGVVAPAGNDSGETHIEIVSDIPPGIVIDSLEDGTMVIRTEDVTEIDTEIILTFVVVNDLNIPVDTLTVRVSSADTMKTDGKSTDPVVSVVHGNDPDAVTDSVPDTVHDSVDTNRSTDRQTVIDTVVAPGSLVRISLPVEKTDTGKTDLQFTGLPEDAKVVRNETGDSVIITWTSGKEDEVVIITAHAPLSGSKSDGDSVRIEVHSKLEHADALFADTNANGYIDRIRLSCKDSAVFREDLPDAEVWISSITMQLLNRESITLTPAALVRRDAGQLDILLKEHHGMMQTGWIKAAVTCTDYPMTTTHRAVTVDKVIDGAGPVIASAEAFGPKIGAAERFDRLKIVFSEPLHWTNRNIEPEKTFAVKCRTGRLCKPFAGLSHRSVAEIDSTIVVLIIDNGYSFEKDSDSLSFILPETAHVKDAPMDASGNRPSKNNNPVLVRVSSGSGVALCPNPFNPETSVEPFGGRKGTLIIVQCQERNADNEAWVTILDAAGSIVVDKKYMEKHASNDRWLTYLWNGCARDGHVVGCGMYAVKIQVKNRKTGEYYPVQISKVGVVRDLLR